MDQTGPDRQPPLAGLRVVDIATFIAAPVAAGILGEFGAEVIKLEQPGTGDPLRKFGTPSPRGDSYCWLSESRNKLSATLDLRAPEGAALFRKLMAETDVLCENFRPGTLERWGLAPAELQKINPRLVVLRVSGYGQTGPYKDRPGFARIAHAFGGLAHLTGMPGGPPLTPGSTSLADYISGVYGALGAMLALKERERSGLGQVIDLALFEPVLRMLDELPSAFSATGESRGRVGLGTTNACPHGHFPTKDDHWVAIACTNDKMFERLAGAMGRPELAADDRYGRAAARIADNERVDKLVSAWTGSMDREALLEICVAAQVPCASVNAIEDIFEDPQIAARAALTEVLDETLGAVTMQQSLPKLSATPGSARKVGPRLGEHNDWLYGERLGLSPAEIAALREKGVV